METHFPTPMPHPRATAQGHIERMRRQKRQSQKRWWDTLSPEEKTRRNRENALKSRAKNHDKYYEVYRLGGAGILTPRQVVPAAPSYCGFDVYDRDAFRGGRDGMHCMGDGCFRAHSREYSFWSRLIDEQQMLEEGDFGMMYL